MPNGIMNLNLHWYDQPTLFDRLNEKSIDWKGYFGFSFHETRGAGAPEYFERESPRATLLHSMVRRAAPYQLPIALGGRRPRSRCARSSRACPIWLRKATVASKMADSAFIAPPAAQLSQAFTIMRMMNSTGPMLLHGLLTAATMDAIHMRLDGRRTNQRLEFGTGEPGVAVNANEAFVGEQALNHAFILWIDQVMRGQLETATAARLFQCMPQISKGIVRVGHIGDDRRQHVVARHVGGLQTQYSPRKGSTRETRAPIGAAKTEQHDPKSRPAPIKVPADREFPVEPLQPHGRMGGAVEKEGGAALSN